MKEKDNTYCIYIHTNKINKKVYIGQTKLKPYSKRWGKNGSYYSGCTYFYAAIQKYGWKNFEHNILEDNLTLTEANEKEKYYIQKYNSTDPNFGYNISKGGYNYIMSEDTKRKISEVCKGRKKSKQTKQKMSENQHLKRKIKCIETQEIFDSITSAGHWAGLTDGNSILNFLKGASKSAGKHPITKEKLHWEYIN